MSDDGRESKKPERREFDLQKWLLAFTGTATILLAMLLFRFIPAQRHAVRSAVDDAQKTDRPSQSSSNVGDWASQFSNASTTVANKMMPAVVSLRVYREELASDDEELTSYFGQLPVPKSLDTGSGYFIRPDGWIITNFHVVRQAKKIEVIQSNGERLLGNLVAFDTASDLAIVRVEATDRPWLRWASQPPTTGSLVWVAGAPFGLDGSLSMGIISAMERTSLSGSPMRDYLQTDAVVNPGHSGGPVVNTDGEVVGVASMILGDEYRGIGFALPSETAKSVSDQLIETGVVVRGWIGAQFGQVTAERARRTGIEELRGAYVERITSSAAKPVPADQAGLRVGDICTAINDRVVQSQFDLGRSIAMMKPPEIARLTIIRNGQSINIDVAIAAKP